MQLSDSIIQLYKGLLKRGKRKREDDGRGREARPNNDQTRVAKIKEGEGHCVFCPIQRKQALLGIHCSVEQTVGVCAASLPACAIISALAVAAVAIDMHH
jgi:hypothetical protein